MPNLSLLGMESPMWSEAPDEFKEFSQQWGLSHNDSHIVSPYHPEANGLAEKSVKDYSPKPAKPNQIHISFTIDNLASLVQLLMS